MRSQTFNYKRIIALVSDLHAGAKHGPFPKMTDFEGAPLGLNKGQKQITKFYYKFIARCDEVGVDTVVLNGDLMHGMNPKQKGIQLTTPNMDLQRVAAVKLLEPLCKDRNVHVLSGSPYHESYDTRMHAIIADLLFGGGVVQSTSGDKVYSFGGVSKKVRFQGLLANIELAGQEGLEDTKSPIPINKKMKRGGSGLIMNIVHGVSSAKIYRTMLMDRAALFQAVMAGLGYSKFVPDIIIRGHWHQYLNLEYRNTRLIQLPGWTAWIPWRGALFLYGKQPDIGAAILYIDEDDNTSVEKFIMEENPKISDALRQG